jgi:2,4-dienoyl-CoA reductase-like NADH-dependent reductase (Old Yellow Enzyme family)/thioredoxin reductase
MDQNLFNKLFQSITIGKTEFKNRFVLAPLGTYLSDNGFVSDRQKTHYLRYARGGAGLLITESCYVHPEGNHGKNRLGIHIDDVIPKLRKLTDLIHANDSKIVIQLNHAGRFAPTDVIGAFPLAPSTIPSPKTNIPPRTLNTNEISALIEFFAQAALRAYKAGFDGIQLLAASGQLLNQFLSPTTNKRGDKYGGNLAGRSMILVETIKRIKALAGNEFPVMVKLSVCDPAFGGLSPEDAEGLAKILEHVGADAIFLSGTSHDADEVDYPYARHLSKLIKDSVSIPVGYAGRIRTLEDALLLVKEGIADLVEIGRGLLADPEFPKKIKEGRENEIRPCVLCDHCTDRVGARSELHCTVNPDIGSSSAAETMRPKILKKILIIGGGPAGMEAAIVAAERGHKVTLCEKDKELGGQLKLAIVPPGKEEGLLPLLTYYKERVEKAGVTVKTGTKITSSKIKKYDPDVVILATGSSPRKLSIQNSSKIVEFTGHSLLSMPDGSIPSGKKFVVVGGGRVATETAEYLATKGNEVTMIVRRNAAAVAEEVGPAHRQRLLKRLNEKGVRILLFTVPVAFETNHIVIKRMENIERIATDYVVQAIGSEKEDGLIRILRQIGKEFYSIGDCIETRTIRDAIVEGREISMRL